MQTGNLQTRLVFLFFVLILLTNGIFAVVAVSRERIQLDKSLIDLAKFLGHTMQRYAKDCIISGNDRDFKNIFDNRPPLLAELKITIYDTNWWVKAGDEARIPLDGFPVIDSPEKIYFKSGTDSAAREIFFPVVDKSRIIGAIGIGIPSVISVKSFTPFFDFLIILIINLFIGVVVAMIISRSIFQPLSSLMEGIDAFAEGNYALRVQTTGHGELHRLCETFNRMAATVQDNIRENLLRNRMLDEKLQELWEIYEIARNISFSFDLPTILERLIEKAQTLSFSSYSQIILQNRLSGKFEAVFTDRALPEVKTEDYENSLNKCYLESQLQEKFSNGYTMIFVPLLSGKRVQGILFLAKHDSSDYSEGNRRFLQTIAPLAASVIENVRLYEELSMWNTNLKNIMASVNAGLGAFDRKGRLITFNDKFFDFFFTVSRPEKVETIQEFCDNLPDRSFANQLSIAISAFLLPVEESQCRHRNIRYKTVWQNANVQKDFEIRLMPLLNLEEVCGAVVVFDDITEQRKFEQQMIESEKWAVLGRLAASVAHEIRNPLVAIRSLVEIIGENVSGDLKEHVGVILGEVLRLNRVVVELLSLVRPETAQMEYVQINNIINELLLLVKHEAARNNITIRTSIANEEYRILLDKEKIKQAFLNIILNAIQAIGEGGVIEITLAKKGSFVEVCFCNNGPQIPQELCEKIFEPFFTTKSTGTGLGLAITRRIAQLHRGSIDVISSSESTQFIFALPLES